MISVIMVSYNAAEYIGQAIESCLNQTYEELELIIGDDGSNDESLDIIVDYTSRSSKISYFIMDRPKVFPYGVIGPMRVSNIIKEGLKRAKGQYVAFISADDYYIDNDKFRREVCVLENDRNVVSCFSNYKDVWDDGREQIKDIIPDNKFVKNRYLFWCNGYCHISTFVTRIEVFAENKLLDRLCDDTGLLYLILRSGKYVCEDEIAFAYRQHSDSVTKSFDNLELDIIELMLFQDIINRYGLSLSTGARFFRPYRHCLQNRNLMSDIKYRKYVVESNAFNHDFIGLLAEKKKSVRDRSRITLYYLCLAFCRVVYKFARVL